MNLISHVGSEMPGLAQIKVGWTSRAHFHWDAMTPGRPHFLIKLKARANQTGHKDSAGRWPQTSTLVLLHEHMFGSWGGREALVKTAKALPGKSL